MLPPPPPPFPLGLDADTAATTAAANVAGLKNGAGGRTSGSGAMVAASMTAAAIAAGLVVKGVLSFFGSTIYHGFIGLALANILRTTLDAW